MPASMAGLPAGAGRNGRDRKNEDQCPFCEPAGLPVRRRRLRGERGKTPWRPLWIGKALAAADQNNASAAHLIEVIVRKP
jgi:hypothetical protein